MNILAWLTVVYGVVAVSLATVQLASAIRFARVLARPARPTVPDRGWPRAAILLSLRGADPSLARGLRQLMTQDYPNFSIRIAVDSSADPAVEVVRRVVAETGCQNVSIETLTQPLSTCSLKCSALVQLAMGLTTQDEVVVLADADLVSHDNWLQELIAPLGQPGVGATFGNRWFWPQNANWGSLVRYTWNLGAVMPMYFLSIPWGGTFAIRAEVLRESSLLEQWSKAVVEDAPACAALRERGLTLRFVPSLMMVNHEDCTLPFAFDFIKRQLTWTRLYHPHWIPVALHTALATMVMVGGFVLPVAAAIVSAPFVLVCSLTTFAAYALSAFATIFLLELSVRRVVNRRQSTEFPQMFSLLRLIKFLLSLPLAQTVQFIATLTAMIRRQVAWRGVTYKINGPWEVDMVEYQQFQQPVDTGGNLSL